MIAFNRRFNIIYHIHTNKFDGHRPFRNIIFVGSDFVHIYIENFLILLLHYLSYIPRFQLSWHHHFKPPFTQKTSFTPQNFLLIPGKDLHEITCLVTMVVCVEGVSVPMSETGMIIPLYANLRYGTVWWTPTIVSTPIPSFIVAAMAWEHRIHVAAILCMCMSFPKG